MNDLTEHGSIFTLKHLVLKIRFSSENSLLNSEKRATNSKLVAHFSLFRSEFSLLKRIFNTKCFSV